MISSSSSLRSSAVECAETAQNQGIAHLSPQFVPVIAVRWFVCGVRSAGQSWGAWVGNFVLKFGKPFFYSINPLFRFLRGGDCSGSHLSRLRPLPLKLS